MGLTYVSTSTKNTRLIIFDLFLYADGVKTPDEGKMFRSYCEKMEVEDDDREKIESICKTAFAKIAEEERKRGFRHVKEEQVMYILEDLLNGKDTYLSAEGSEAYNIFGAFSMGTGHSYHTNAGWIQMDFPYLNRNKSEQATVIWNLLNLGYADKTFSEEEKRVIDFLCKYWKMSDGLRKELEDSVDTLNSLYSQKEETSKREELDYWSYEYAKVLDQDIERVKNSVEITISNAELYENA